MCFSIKSITRIWPATTVNNIIFYIEQVTNIFYTSLFLVIVTVIVTCQLWISVEFYSAAKVIVWSNKPFRDLQWHPQLRLLHLVFVIPLSRKVKHSPGLDHFHDFLEHCTLSFRGSWTCWKRKQKRSFSTCNVFGCAKLADRKGTLLHNILSLLLFVSTHQTHSVSYLKYVHFYYIGLSRNYIFIDKVSWVCSGTRNSSFEMMILRYLRDSISIILDSDKLHHVNDLGMALYRIVLREK